MCYPLCMVLSVHCQLLVYFILALSLCSIFICCFTCFVPHSVVISCLVYFLINHVIFCTFPVNNLLIKHLDWIHLRPLHCIVQDLGNILCIFLMYLHFVRVCCGSHRHYFIYRILYIVLIPELLSLICVLCCVLNDCINWIAY